MNAVHLHLLTNHLPILGTAFGLLVLVYGMTLRTPSQPVRTAAYLILILSALGAFVANVSGEGAEDAVERLPGVTHDAIEAHEDAAPFAVAASALAGALALAGIAAGVLKPAWGGRVALAAALAALVAFAAAARTGWLGGKIRHTELDGAPSTAQPREPGKEERGD